MTPIPSRESLAFWVAAYKAGYRITATGGKVEITAAWHYWDRLTAFEQFGVFPEPIQVDPPEWVVTGLQAHGKGLAGWLMTPAPNLYRPFFWHLLTLDYEAKPIMHHAHRSGIGIGDMGVDGGRVLVLDGVVPPDGKQEKPPELTPIVRRFAELRIA